MFKKKTTFDYLVSGSFYQSNDWKNINILYGREIFEWSYLGKKWWGTIKTSKKLGFSWLQTIGIHGYDEDEIFGLYNYLYSILKKYNGIFLQIGFTDNIGIIYKCKNLGNKDNTFYINKRNEIYEDFYQVNYKKSVIENMPLSNIFYDFNNIVDQDYTNQTKRLLKKSLSYIINFQELNNTELLNFYQKWFNVGKLKGFNIINYEQFIGLYNLKQVKIFVLKDEIGNILAGHICYLYRDNILIYLYGFVERNKYQGLGQLMIHNITHYCKNNNIQFYDTWGGSPTGYDNHDLLSVSKFKESFGGYKVEYYGNYDIVNNSILKRFMYYLLNKFYFKKHT